MPTEPDARHRLFDAMRATTPVYRDAPSSTFILTRYDNARALLCDNTLWKDADRASRTRWCTASNPST